jgi:HlyD family secretion protein
VPNAALRFRPADLPVDDMLQRARDGAMAANSESINLPGMPGRVFVLGSDAQLTLVPLRLGASDGRTTEVLAGALAEGHAVVIGAAPSGSTAPRQVGFRLL